MQITADISKILKTVQRDLSFIFDELSESVTLMSLIFAGTKFRGFRGLGGHPRNLIPAKWKFLAIREI